MTHTYIHIYALHTQEYGSLHLAAASNMCVINISFRISLHVLQGNVFSFFCLVFQKKMLLPLLLLPLLPEHLRIGNHIILLKYGGELVVGDNNTQMQYNGKELLWQSHWRRYIGALLDTWIWGEIQWSRHTSTAEGRWFRKKSSYELFLKNVILEWIPEKIGENRHFQVKGRRGGGRGYFQRIDIV